MTFVNHWNAEQAKSELARRYNLHFVDLLVESGAKVYLFGGALRDMVMGKDWKDADIRVWIPLPQMERDKKVEEILARAGEDIKAKVVFPTFTVYRFLPKGSVSEVGVDVSVVSDQWLVGPDFTINGLYFDIATSELIDPHGAIADIEQGLIRTALSPQVQFADEPHMLFRAVKAASQFSFSIEEKTLEAMKSLSPSAEGVFALVADNTMEGMTEWFLGNIFRGLKYSPTQFEQIWNETGLTDACVSFVCKRLGLDHQRKESREAIFKSGTYYTYEEAVSMWLSLIARASDNQNAEKNFSDIVTLLRINEPKKHEDFIIDTSKVVYASGNF